MEGRLRPAHVEPFKGMGTIRTNADLHVEDERQRRIGRDVHEDGAVLLFLGGNGEIAVLAELHAGEACTEDTGHDQRRLRETLHDPGKLPFGVGHARAPGR